MDGDDDIQVVSSTSPSPARSSIIAPEKLNSKQLLKLISTNSEVIKLESRKLSKKKNEYVFNIFVNQKAVAYCFCKKCSEVISSGGNVSRHAAVCFDQKASQKRKLDNEDTDGLATKKPSIAGHFTQPASMNEKAILTNFIAEYALNSGASFRSCAMKPFRDMVVGCSSLA